MVLVSTLVLDYNVYPRHEVDSFHVGDIMHAMEAGITLPPVIADRTTKRVVDGFHRVTAVQRSSGPDATIKVEWRDYASEAELFADAMRLNAGHGQRLSPFDKARCIQIGESLQMQPSLIASCLAITTARFQTFRARKIAVGPNQQPVPIKATLHHLVQETLTPKQIEGNERAGGMRPMFYVNQVINLIEHDLIDRDDDHLCERLRLLASLLEARLAVGAA